MDEFLEKLIKAQGTEARPMYDKRHGGPYDRGSADKYYGRPFDPHYYKGDSYFSPKVTDLTPDEVMAYKAGYNEETDQKDWG